MKTLYQKLHDARMAVPWHISRVAESAGNYDANWAAEVDQVTNERNMALLAEEIERMETAKVQALVTIRSLQAGESSRAKSSALTRFEEGLFWIMSVLGEPISQDAQELAQAHADLREAERKLNALIDGVKRRALELSQQIEGCGASAELTTASILATQIYQSAERASSTATA